MATALAQVQAENSQQDVVERRACLAVSNLRKFANKPRTMELFVWDTRSEGNKQPDYTRQAALWTTRIDEKTEKTKPQKMKLSRRHNKERKGEGQVTKTSRSPLC